MPGREVTRLAAKKPRGSVTGWLGVETAATDRSRESDSWRAYRLEGARRLLSKGNFTVTDGVPESVPPRLYGGTERIVA